MTSGKLLQSTTKWMASREVALEPDTLAMQKVVGSSPIIRFFFFFFSRTPRPRPAEEAEPR